MVTKTGGARVALGGIASEEFLADERGLGGDPPELAATTTRRTPKYEEEKKMKEAHSNA